MRRLLTVLLLLGVVSLLADVAYEGARSILGPLLRVLESPGAVAGVVPVGELVAYAMRGVAGVVASSGGPGRLWLLMFLGYGVNLVAVPMLALASSWEQVLALVLLERAGKGVRGPARDALVAEVSKGIGAGRGFGVHELLDQVGAIAGPLLVSLALAVGGYRLAFLLLALPAACSLAVLGIARKLYHGAQAVMVPRYRLARPSILVIGASLASLGLVHWVLAGYLMAGRLPAQTVAQLYAAAMAVDAILALPLGELYERTGPHILLALPPAAATPTLLLALGHPLPAALAWGLAMAFYETAVKAAVADTTPAEERPAAYAWLGILQGAAWTIGNVVISQLSVTVLPAYLALVEALAAVLIASSLLKS